MSNLYSAGSKNQFYNKRKWASVLRQGTVLDKSPGSKSDTTLLRQDTVIDRKGSEIMRSPSKGNSTRRTSLSPQNGSPPKFSFQVGRLCSMNDKYQYVFTWMYLIVFRDIPVVTGEDLFFGRHHLCNIR
jgi:hypothetical protein